MSGVIIAGSISSSALAWHPKGKIEKKVMNQTSSSELKDFVQAENGDTLKYVITVSNVGKSNSKGYNDMHYTILEDELPEGVELVSDPEKRTIEEDLGVIKPGQEVTKEYLVKVTSETDNDVITNTACFSGDSEVKDAPQKGCNEARVSVDVPPVPEPEIEVPEEEPEVLPDVDDGKGGGELEPKHEALPKTGMAANIAGVFTGISGIGYSIHRLAPRLRRYF